MSKKTKRIVAREYYTLKEAVETDIDSKKAFIISNEKMTKKETVGRYFTVFKSFRDFLLVRSHYPHCHEILVDHSKARSNPAGRLVFDFDIAKPDGVNIEDVLPNNFTDQIEYTIVEVVEQYFRDVDTEAFEFVWSTSQNPKKISKHLTVKNLYFDNWVVMSKIFYQLFCLSWSESYDWISSEDLVDMQIARNRGSLRMTGSSKIGGSKLVLDDDRFSLQDSLIRIYTRSERKSEQLVSVSNLNNGVLENVLDVEIDVTKPALITTSYSITDIEVPFYPPEIYEKAFELFEKIQPKAFTIGKIRGKNIYLFRKKKSKCIISGRCHENDNAFLTVNLSTSVCSYVVKYGCYRFCGSDKTCKLGTIDLYGNSVSININNAHASDSRTKSHLSLNY